MKLPLGSAVDVIEPAETVIFAMDRVSPSASEKSLRSDDWLIEKGVSSWVPPRLVEVEGVVEMGESATEKTEKEFAADTDSPLESVMVYVN